MFAQIKGVIELVVSGFKVGLEFKSKREREDAVLGLLRFYYVLKDCVDEGNALIFDAGADPVERIRALDPAEAKKVVSRWDAALRRQASRLYSLAGQLGGQHALEVLNPSLSAEIQEAIGSKWSRTMTLGRIGAPLVIRAMFPFDESPEEIAHLVSVMVGATNDKLNLKRIGREVDLLEKALDSYRDHVEAMVTKDELLKLSAKARSQTLFPPAQQSTQSGEVDAA